MTKIHYIEDMKKIATIGYIKIAQSTQTVRDMEIETGVGVQLSSGRRVNITADIEYRPSLYDPRYPTDQSSDVEIVNMYPKTSEGNSTDMFSELDAQDESDVYLYVEKVALNKLSDLAPDEFGPPEPY